MDEQGQFYHIQNPLIGKTYHFVSAYGMTRRAFYDLRIYSMIEVTPDRILISAKPKKEVKVPAIFLEDITGIDISIKISFYSILCTGMMFLSFILTANWWYFILAALFLWCGINRKITIMQRNGIDVILYSRKKEAAMAFKEDMRMILNIR